MVYILAMIVFEPTVLCIMLQVRRIRGNVCAVLTMMSSQVLNVI
jgi:hypothetical protein